MSDVVEDLINDHEFIVTLARFADGLISEAAIRKRYSFTDEVWASLGENDRLVEKIELEKARRIRRGDTARERAQTHFARRAELHHERQQRVGAQSHRISQGIARLCRPQAGNSASSSSRKICNFN